MKRTETAGGVVLNGEGLVLVVNQNGNSWSLPKGHIGEGEDRIQAARREILEESGISKVELVKDLGSYQRYKIALDGGDDTSELKTIHVALFTTEQNELKPIDPDNPEARWVKKEDVAGLLTHAKDKEFFVNVMNRINR